MNIEEPAEKSTIMSSVTRFIRYLKKHTIDVIVLSTIAAFAIYFSYKYVYLDQRERDINNLNEAFEDLVCVYIDLGWCFCTTEGEGKFTLGTPHCSILENENISMRVYRIDEVAR